MQQPSPSSFQIMVPWWRCLVVGGGLPLVNTSYNLGSALPKNLQNPQGLVHSDQKQEHPGPTRTVTMVYTKPLDLSNLYT
jgi:hypothetical protein